jgi:hypothetical protein
MILLTPAFLLVDHGHFQYNCVMLGLVFLGYISIVSNHEYLGCVFFTIALSKKQMAMYYALGFFSILIGKALLRSRLLIESNYRFNVNMSTIIEFLVIVFSYGWIVIIISLILWSPWISYTLP